MNGRETVRVAWGGIVANKLRSGLTVLGMTIGVASVIVLVAVGEGSKAAVQAGIEALGTNVLLVQSQAGPGGPGRQAASSTASLTEADATALEDPFDAPDVKSAAPVVSAASATLVAGALSYAPATFVGTTPAYAATRDYTAASGEMFTARQVSDHDRVAVVGPTVVENLFSGANPVGQAMRVNGATFRVIGVTAEKGSTGTQDADDVVLAPLTAVQDTVSGYTTLSSITVQAASAAKIDAAQAEVESILNERHDVSDPDASTLSVINQSSVLAVSDASTSVFTTLLGSVAAVSLLVGGIGVMNIMLVSVTERTREIGIRKAIGARRADILKQFLTEAVLVSMLGGLVGVLLGLGVSRFEIAGVAPAVAPYSVGLAFGAALLSGLFFGTYPARRAAGLRPIEALRFE